MNMHQRISVRVKQKPSALDRSNACETPYYPAAGPIDEHAARVRYPLLSFIFFPGRLVDLGSRQASHAPNFFYHPNANPIYIYNLACARLVSHSSDDDEPAQRDRARRGDGSGAPASRVRRDRPAQRVVARARVRHARRRRHRYAASC